MKLYGAYARKGKTTGYAGGYLFLFVRFSYYKSCDIIISNIRSIKIHKALS